MNIFVEVFSDEGRKVTFYTVRKDEAAFSETEDFFRRMSNEKKYKEDLNKLIQLIKSVIGNKFGAHKKYFSRHENEATALPPNRVHKFKGQEAINFSYFPLRLYTLKVSESVVVLFNGGIKLTEGSAQDDPKVSMYFHEANQYAKRIKKAIREGDIYLNHKSMVDFQGNKIITL
jgi:hypothetical protein